MVQVKNPVIEALKERIEELGSQKAVADDLDIAPSYLNDVLQGKRNPGEDLLEKLGYSKVVVHVKTNTVDAVLKAIASVEAESTKSTTKK